MVLLTSVLNLPGLLRLSDLLARILTVPFYLNIIFLALASCCTFQRKVLAWLLFPLFSALQWK